MSDVPTPNEARDEIVQAARMAARWWSRPDPSLDGKTCAERIEGAIFKFLAELDGVGSLPSCNIVMLTSDDEGETIGETRVSTMLHEFFFEKRA